MRTFHPSLLTFPSSQAVIGFTSFLWKSIHQANDINKSQYISICNLAPKKTLSLFQQKKICLARYFSWECTGVVKNCWNICVFKELNSMFSHLCWPVKTKNLQFLQETASSHLSEDLFFFHKPESFSNVCNHYAYVVSTGHQWLHWGLFTQSLKLS